MNRRDFLKIVGITTATSTAALYGCGSKEGSSEGSKVLGPIPTDKMTYRSFPGLGSDKVSILGYGCMRWHCCAKQELKRLLPKRFPISLTVTRPAGARWRRLAWS